MDTEEQKNIAKSTCEVLGKMATGACPKNLGFVVMTMPTDGAGWGYMSTNVELLDLINVFEKTLIEMKHCPEAGFSLVQHCNVEESPDPES